MNTTKEQLNSMDVMGISSMDSIEQVEISLHSRNKIPSRNSKHSVVIQEIEDRID